MLKQKLTNEQRKQIPNLEVSSESAVDLIFGASVGAYLGSSINHADFTLFQAFALGFVLICACLFIFFIKWSARAFVLGLTYPIILFSTLTLIWLLGLIPQNLAMAGIDKVLFFQMPFVCWLIAYAIMGAILRSARET